MPLQVTRKEDFWKDVLAPIYFVGVRTNFTTGLIISGYGYAILVAITHSSVALP